MTTPTHDPLRTPPGCLYLLLMIVALFFVLRQAEQKQATGDENI